ncbi:hypothetical protein [Amycolatopsis anabasis]|uniref:hypothetical protein n=1 Tax=Amycolatopsis anabasis TaxID=1840409 RepID=UPI00131B5AAE|nr:hypothetical protein [Amycolatopsis anabasis]
MNAHEKRIAALARLFVRFERLYDEDRAEYQRRFRAGYPERLYARLLGLVGSTWMVADGVIREARDYYRERIHLDCGHVHTFYVTSQQLTGQTHRYLNGLFFAPQAYWETGPMYCNHCDGRPERTVTLLEVENHRMACEEITLECGHTLKRMHRANQPFHPRDISLARRCTGCLGQYREGVSVRTLRAAPTP